MRARWAVAVAGAAVLTVGGPAAPAAAHPFGPPPVATMTAEGARIDVRWAVAADDVVALGYHTGAIPTRRTFVFEDGVPADAPGQVDDSDAALVAASPAVAEYLTDGFRVRQDGRPCPGRVDDAGDLTTAGAHLVFTCPSRVRTVELEVTLLTDLHPAYRTVLLAAGGARPERSISTLEDPTGTVTFGGGGGGGAPVSVLVGVLVTGTAALACGAALWRRAGPRRTDSRAT